ncbi:hypothetical protein [Pseudonocardia alni]|uniref:Tellurite resistance protein TehA-like permease n=1 Tax=Pseudonocardia alni TaxID=33907 RepID=A0A852VY78_PSEA5|nr:hypothetical protein [Pseudonocardia antarctica]NYG01000.1 tellurite resistance protein TehA-like permease [Pseudonocardia antarctica]
MITSRPGQAGPPWSGAVMGTGIVAVATTLFPVPEPGLRVVGTVLWLLAAASLVALGVLRRVLVRLGTAGLALADTPTVVIVPGPFGQSVTAANLLAGEAQGLLPEPFAGLAIGAGLLYGAPAWGFAAGWTVLSAVLIGHALRRGMSFSACWWAATVPFGTLVPGTNALAARTALPPVVGAAVVLFAVLVLVWVVVAAATVRSALSEVADEIGPPRRTVRA